MNEGVIIVGGRLAGREAGWQLARPRGPVARFEMRPQAETGAHRTDQLAVVANGPLTCEHLSRAQAQLTGAQPLALAREATPGALGHYVRHAIPERFQPLKGNSGLLPELTAPPNNKRQRAQAYSARAVEAVSGFRKQQPQPLRIVI